MPIFEYLCTDCAHRFEAIVLGAERPHHCPSCDGESLEKQLSVFAVGSPSSAASPRLGPAPCGSCGDPRGPGSCSLN